MFDKDFNNWGVISSDVKVKTDEELYQFRIGSFVFCMDCEPHYDILMRKSTYDKLRSGEYLIDEAFDKTLKIITHDGKDVPKFTSLGACYEVY